MMPIRPLHPHGLPLALLFAGSLACGESSVPRVRIGLELRAHGLNPTFVTESGWSVEVETARLAVESLRFFEGEPQFTQRRFRLLPEAWAHPGHYAPGDAVAEIVTPVVLELSAERPTTLEGQGVSGYFGSAEVRLRPRDGVTASSAGRASKAGRELRFELRTDLDTAVDGIAVQAEVPGDVRFELSVDLSRWLGRIDFDALPAGTSTISFVYGSQGHNAFLRGVNNTSAFIIEKE